MICLGMKLKTDLEKTCLYTHLFFCQTLYEETDFRRLETRHEHFGLATWSIIIYMSVYMWWSVSVRLAMCVAKVLMTIIPFVVLSSIVQTFDLIRGRDSIVWKLCIMKSFAFFILTKMSVCLMDCKVSAVYIQDHIHSTKTNSD